MALYNVARIARIAVLMAVPVLPASAYAWEQSMTCVEGIDCEAGQKPQPIRWETPCVEMHLNEAGTQQMEFAEVRAITGKAVAAWNVPTRSSLVMQFGGLTDEDRVGYNPYIRENANIIVFRDDGWTESRSIMALTSVTHRPSDGIIVDADIEVNTYRYEFGTVTESNRNVVDLQNTLTHELGHVLGLDHSWDTDDATMNAYSVAGVTYMRDLAEDDLEGLSTIYPLPERTECRFSGEYFERPPYAMDEGYPTDGSCTATGYRAEKKSLSGGLSFLLLCLIVVSFAVRRPAGRVRRTGMTLTK